MRSRKRSEPGPRLGDLELEVLQFIASDPPKTVREVAEQYGEPRGLARTTILTVMERLRKKGYLQRSPGKGAFHYAPGREPAEVMDNLVRNFVERTLGGSIQPFMAYLANSRGLTQEETAQLNELAERLDSEKGDADE